MASSMSAACVTCSASNVDGLPDMCTAKSSLQGAQPAVAHEYVCMPVRCKGDLSAVHVKSFNLAVTATCLAKELSVLSIHVCVGLDVKPGTHRCNPTVFRQSYLEVFCQAAISRSVLSTSKVLPRLLGQGRQYWNGC